MPFGETPVAAEMRDDIRRGDVAQPVGGDEAKRGGNESRPFGRTGRRVAAEDRNCPLMYSMTNFTDDPEALYRWRDEMADLIEEVSAK